MHLSFPPRVSLITKSWFQGPVVSYLDCRNSHTTCAPDLRSLASSAVREQCTNLSMPFLLRTSHLDLFLLGYRQKLTEPGVPPPHSRFLLVCLSSHQPSSAPGCPQAPSCPPYLTGSPSYPSRLICSDGRRGRHPFLRVRSPPAQALPLYPQPGRHLTLAALVV